MKGIIDIWDQSHVKISGICLHEISLSVPSEDFELQSFSFKGTEKPKQNPSKMLRQVWGQASQGPQDSDMDSDVLLQSFSICQQKLMHRIFFVFS